MIRDEIHITLDDVTLVARLHIPNRVRGLVIIAEGKDCKMLKVQNEYLSRALSRKCIATLFTFLLDPPENQEYDIPFDIELIREHLEKVTRWVFGQDWLYHLPVGYFAVNTAAAAALEASLSAGYKIKAIVSHCGRPDLAGPRLNRVKSATLLITASENIYLNELNWQAYNLLTCEKQLVTIDGNPSRFEAIDKARQVAYLSANWFDRHFPMMPSGRMAVTAHPRHQIRTVSRQ